MKYTINKLQRPVYQQIYRQLRDDIISGAYSYNERLPSKRNIAQELNVSIITAEHAYALLCEEGYAEARQKSGYFVSFKKSDGFAAAHDTEESVVLTVQSKPDYPLFSASILSKTMRSTLSEFGEKILDSSPNKGLMLLRSAIKRYLMRNRGIQADEEQIIIGSGAEYLYGLLAELMGSEKTFAIEYPSYEKIEQIYSIRGVKCERLPLSKDGIDSRALSNCNADVLHVTPYRSYPSGVSASASKRHEYIRWAQTGKRFIAESDYGSEFSFSKQPMESLFVLSGQDNVIYFNTFSRTISPSMRMGYMVLPKQLVKEFDRKLGFYSCSVPTFEQLVLYELIQSGSLERHINRVRRETRKRE